MIERRTVVSGLGFYVPPRVVTNFDLEKMMNTSDEWIRERTGILERHWAESGVGASDLGYEAAVKAIENAGLDKNDIDFI
ncbi:MAG TPA: 3-oxoacyl-ACP synthase, partial [Candidatus Saccharicenans sp.]|nr:3-oxoacyl-ACP synthase [Candidatus Saccharicenans sp.]